MCLELIEVLTSHSEATNRGAQDNLNCKQLKVSNAEVKQPIRR